VGRARLSGLIDFPDFNVPPGSRRGVAPDAAAEAFASALRAFEPMVSAELDRLDLFNRTQSSRSWSDFATFSMARRSHQLEVLGSTYRATRRLIERFRSDIETFSCKTPSRSMFLLGGPPPAQVSA
jgi:hypothetical protein